VIGGPAVTLGIAASWYLLALWQGGGEFFQRQVLDENIFRFLDSDQGGPSRDHAFYYYVPMLCVGMLPWSLFFPALGHYLYRARAQLREAKLLYLVVWCGAELLFFSLASGKRSNYILPLYPAVALLLGIWWQELVDGSLAFSPLVKRLARVCASILCVGFSLMIVFLIAHGAGLDLAHLVSPFLHPRDRANLPLVAQSLQSHFPIVLVWLSMLIFAMGWYCWGLKRDQWMSVCAALTVSISSSLYFTNALFHPLLAQERTYKPFILGARSTVKDAPLFFYKDAYDYGAIFYAGRHIPSYTDDLAKLTVDGKADTPLYLLMWEEDWKVLATVASDRFQPLVTSEGKGPDKKRRLVLVAVLPQQTNDSQHSQNG
jgi:hypothetical protein